MSKITFEEARQAIVEQKGAANWIQTVCENEPVMSFVKETAEYMAKSWANEAVKEDRDVLNSICESIGVYIYSTIKTRVLPYRY